MILTYKYRLKGKRSERLLRRYAWAVNQVWNFCVSTQREKQLRWKNGSRAKDLTGFDLINLTSGTSRVLELPAKSVQSVCEQFANNRDQHKKFPRFRRSGSMSRRSLGWIPFSVQARQIDGNAVIYRGDSFRFFGARRRPLPSTAKGGSFVENARGQWFVCFHVEIASDRSLGDGIVGLDLGLKHLAVMSNGKKIDNIRPLATYVKKLAAAQRAGNKARTKAVHCKIANVRRDHLHKASAIIVRENKFIAVGNISTSRLAKTRMAKSVLDAGWSTFRNMLRYKASRHGATFLEVDERFTTQTCSSCGDRASEGRPRGIAGLGIRGWTCSSCGVSHDRDVNAAKNILALGLSVQPRVDESRVAYGR